MIASKPSTPAQTMIAATTTNARILVVLPDDHPIRSKTVAVASVASATSTVSQPTRSTHDTNEGSLLPLTPNAAREITMVGAEPRVPASETKPTSRNENTVPTRAATVACQKLTPK